MDDPRSAPSTPPATREGAAADEDQAWHENFWVDNFLFVFPIAMATVFAVFAAVLASQI